MELKKSDNKQRISNDLLGGIFLHFSEGQISPIVRLSDKMVIPHSSHSLIQKDSCHYWWRVTGVNAITHVRYCVRDVHKDMLSSPLCNTVIVLTQPLLVGLLFHISAQTVPFMTTNKQTDRQYSDPPSLGSSHSFQNPPFIKKAVHLASK